MKILKTLMTAAAALGIAAFAANSFAEGIAEDPGPAAYAKALEDGFKQPVSFLHTKEAIEHLNKVRDDFMQYKDLLRQKK